MKKIQATLFNDNLPTSSENISSGYSLGQWWQVNSTGEKYYHKTDGIWAPIWQQDLTPYYTSSQTNANFLSANTTLNYFSGVSLTVYNTYTGSTIPNMFLNYYTSSQTNANFVLKTGDVMTGNLSGTTIIMSADSKINNLTVGRGKNNIQTNTLVGGGSLLSITTGVYNTVYGDSSMVSTTTGSYNLAIGSGTLSANTTGNNNTAIGGWALNFNITGTSNVSIGVGSMWYNTYGSYNTSIGGYSLYNNKIGDRNVAIGQTSLSANTVGSRNVSIGCWNLQNNTIGNYNTSIGTATMFYNISGSGNTAIGYYSLYNITTGFRNIAIGNYAGYYVTTNSDELYIDNRNRTTNALEKKYSLIYGIFDNIPNNQSLYLNSKVYINNNYSLPTISGLSDEVLINNGDSTTSWKNINANFLSANTSFSAYTLQIDFLSHTGNTQHLISEWYNGLSGSHSASTYNHFATMNDVFDSISGSGITRLEFDEYTGNIAPNTYSTIFTFNIYTGTTIPLLLQGVNNNLTAHTSLTGVSNPHQISFNDLVSTGHTHDERYVKLIGDSNIIGNININGNVFISGSASTIFSHNLTVKDNIILLNSGETFSGVTLGYSGIEIDRGLYQNASLIWNEYTDKWEAGLSGSTTEISLLGHNHDSSYYTKNESNANFLSASTTLNYFSGVSSLVFNTYTGITAVNSFLSSNTFQTTINTNGINNTGNVTATTFYGNLNWFYLTNTSHTHNWNNIIEIPTTISGYGITDVYTKNESNNNFLSASTTLNYFSGVSSLDFNTYTGITAVNSFLSANTFQTTINTNGINNTGNITATTFYGNLNWNYLTNTSHTHDWVNITETPTTISGYGIIDCYNSAQTNENFVSSLTYNYYTGTTVPILIQNLNNNLTAHTSLTGASNPHQISFSDLLITAHTHTWIDIDNRFIYTDLSSSTQIDSFPQNLVDGCKWIYTIKNGINVEAGSIIGVWDYLSSAITYTQYSTDSLGNTNDVTFYLDIYNSNIRLMANILSGNWNIKLRRLSI